MTETCQRCHEPDPSVIERHTGEVLCDKCDQELE
jgi:uncharacterized Zn finger protein (UPF0148 family)